MAARLIKLVRRLRRRSNERGVALIMAVSAVALITYLAMEVMYDSTVEYTVNSQSLNRLKAYYAARSGLEIGLLRVKIYQSIMSKMQGKNMGPFEGYVDQIWQFPFAWPMPVPPELNSVDKGMAEKIQKESLFDGTFSLSIQDEGSKIDLADLVSPSKTLRELTKKRLVEIFTRQIEEDEEWRRKYGNFRFDELVNYIGDWMSDKNEGLNGGSKKEGYQDLNQGREYFPPNRGFRTLQEMRMVREMNDEFFDLLSPQVTIYGMRGVNPNIATKEILKSLDLAITDPVVDKIIERRDDRNKGGNFKNADEFWNFVEKETEARFRDDEHKKIPLHFESLISFRISSIGEFSGVTREIVAIVTDLDRTAAKIKKFVDEDKKNETASADPEAATPGGSGNPATPTTPATGNQNVSLPKGPPRIVYWSER